MMDFYGFVYPFIRVMLWLWHPFTKVCGRENIPADGYLICANHASQADPFWVAFALGSRRRMHIMAKKEIMSWPVAGAFCRKLGAFGVDRGGADLSAVKATLTFLKNRENVLLFPEGTRVKPGKQVEPKNGGVLLALRAGVPVLPIYITQRKRPFHALKIIIGKPYMPVCANRRPTSADLDLLTHELMDTIYRMGE